MGSLIKFSFKWILKSYSFWIIVVLFFSLIFIFPRELDPLSLFTKLVNQGIVIISIYSIGILIVDLKQSSLFKRIGASNINKTETIIAFFITGLTILIGFVFFYIMFFIILGAANWFLVPANFVGANINYAGFVYSLFVGMTLAASVTLLIVSVSKTTTMYNAIAVTYFVIFIIISNLYTIGLLKETNNPQFNDLITTISFFIPSIYAQHLMNGSLYAINGSVWSLSGGYNIGYNGNESTFRVAISSTQTILDIFMPFVFLTGLNIASIKIFSWDNTR